jgi:hypothetical protein
MLGLHYWPTPNGKKITIFLEEAGLQYRVVPCNIGRGDQFEPSFLALNPNHRMPVLVDDDPASGGAPMVIFESGRSFFTSPNRAGASGPTTCAAGTRSPSGSSGRRQTRGRRPASSATFCDSVTSGVTSHTPCVDSAFLKP